MYTILLKSVTPTGEYTITCLCSIYCSQSCVLINIFRSVGLEPEQTRIQNMQKVIIL